MGHPLLDLADETAVVIGGTSGIGLALTRALAQAGANVVPTGRRAPQVASAVAEVEGVGPAVAESNLRRHRVTRAWRNFCNQFAGNSARVQILVNCAGRTKRMPTLDFPDSEWNAILDTNLTGTLRACRVFGRHMIEQRYGRIINIASLSSFVALYRSCRIQRQQSGGGFAYEIARH